MHELDYNNPHAQVFTETAIITEIYYYTITDYTASKRGVVRRTSDGRQRYRRLHTAFARRLTQSPALKYRMKLASGYDFHRSPTDI
ncbi:hypothetical protein EVAR_88699_1 [Eumeta japonica]|uniref:Uncharacterized protein n=1 Tax=Eumeta variegata TaxID=151549 RepID=A0A4C1Y453_EUMVA|nr:hypothetical protein EVAR_88699_1 [Eumeta japonica]